MRINKVEIRISGAEGFKKEVLDSLKHPVFGRHMLFLEPHHFHSLFTLERIRLLQAIREHPEAGTVKLSELLGRKQEAVSRDLSALKRAGLVSDEPAGHLEKSSAKSKPATISVVV